MISHSIFILVMMLHLKMFHVQRVLLGTTIFRGKFFAVRQILHITAADYPHNH